MKVVHISDTHGAKYHEQLIIQECDLLLFTGDLGGRTTIHELNEFLIWFDKQPAKHKIFCGGNHDLVLDKHYPIKEKNKGNLFGYLKRTEEHEQANHLIKSFSNIHYLCNSGITIEGLKIWGSPISPSFHKEHWCFNADRGEEIMKFWARIPSDINILLTHTPPYGILDDLKEYVKPGEDVNIGCKDLLAVIKKKLLKLKLHCFGHIHDNYGVQMHNISKTRQCLFSNGAILNNKYKQLIYTPYILNI